MVRRLGYDENMSRLDPDRKKILIVDPACGAHDPLVHRLTASNYEVTVAGSAKFAWRSLTETRPDLVLLETMLPSGTEGFHLVWRVRDHPDERLRQTPIVIVSRIHQTTPLNLFPNLRDGHYAAHDYLPVQGFIDKPVDHHTLLRTIANLFANDSCIHRS